MAFPPEQVPLFLAVLDSGSFTALFRRPPPPLDLRALLTAHLGETA